VRLGVRGHSGVDIAPPERAAVLGESVLRLELPPLVEGIDRGERPTSDAASGRLNKWFLGGHGWARFC
jgi:hypothetical protein